MAAVDAKISVYVEIDVGAGRCGVPPGRPAADLAQLISRQPHLVFAGIHAYQGGAQHLRQPAEREQAILGQRALARREPRAERHLRADDGQALFERQRRAVRLHSWVGREDGMYVWKLAVDPLTGLRLNARLNAATESMFHGGLVPPGAPQDGIERQAFLRAHALVGLLDGYAGGGRPGRPEWVVVEDRRVPAGASPVVDLGLAVELPATVLSRIRAEAVERAVTLDGPVVVGGPGRANLGRASRLASEDQRRLLRALYATCAIDGCTVPFGACVIHHVVWWRHGGRTDLDNLVPICIRHHHRLHDGGWSARLDEHRQLHIRTPSGQTMVSGPNRIDLTTQQTSDSAASVQARPPPSTPPG